MANSNGLATRQTIHGLNYSISTELDTKITMLETLSSQFPNYNLAQREQDISIIIESSNLFPNLLGFICFIGLSVYSYINHKSIHPWYYFSILCMLVYIFGFVNRTMLFLYKHPSLVSLLCMAYLFLHSKFIDKVIILAISYFVLHNILIGVLYIAFLIVFMVVPCDNVSFNNKAVRYVYSLDE